MDVAWLASILIDENLGIFPVGVDPKTVRAALTSASMQYIGFDILEARHATLWVSFQPEGVAVQLDGDFTQNPAGVALASHGATELVALPNSSVVAARLPRGLVLGTEVGVGLALDVSSGKLNALGGTCSCRTVTRRS